MSRRQADWLTPGHGDFGWPSGPTPFAATRVAPPIDARWDGRIGGFVPLRRLRPINRGPGDRAAWVQVRRRWQAFAQAEPDAVTWTGWPQLMARLANAVRRAALNRRKRNPRGLLL